jgi:hypothetical protein
MGIRHAEQARDTLLTYDLGRAALILSAGGLRVRQTAEIIAKGFRTRQIVTQIIVGSAKFNHQGAAPRKLVDLDELIATELEMAGHPADELPGSLVVINNAPLIALARGLTLPEGEAELDSLVPYGSVTSYEPGTWKQLYIPQDAD